MADTEGQAAAVRPMRLRLSRRAGFNMQAVSLAANGLPGVRVDRATKWGNPFVPGQDNPMIPGRKVEDRRHAWQLYRSMAPLNEKLVAAARAELRGVNLFCWCALPEGPEDDCCHAAALLEIANSEGIPHVGD